MACTGNRSHGLSAKDKDSVRGGRTVGDTELVQGSRGITITLA